MSNDGKENIRHVTCTNHTTRSDRDLFRVCPSKLSKRELEDLYFSLLENNKQLKKTVNGQSDQIKLLTTKVNRMTIQKNALGNLNKDCCAGAKAIINEQKESIADLKIANERLSDKIRLLNMRLCSAKQFLRRSPALSTTRCAKCCLTPSPSVKNASMSALNTKGSDANLRSRTEVGSSQLLNKQNSTIKVEEIEASQTETKDEPCQQNKCQTVMDELKQKIENLEKEISKTHEQYSEQIRRAEEQMRELRVENTRVRALQAESDHRLEAGEKRAAELLHKLRGAEMQCDSLATELQIERSKVSELETQVRAADISSQVAEALEKHLKSNTLIVEPNDTEILKFTEPDKDKIVKNSDDSGYAEKFEDKKDGAKTDQNILDQIASLQAQLKSLKLSMKDNDTGDDRKSQIKQSLQKSKSEPNETYTVEDARFNNDGFHSSRLSLDQIDQAPDFLMSLKDTNRSFKTGSFKTLYKLDPLRNFNSAKQIGKKITSDFSLSENHNMVSEGIEKKNDDINKNDDKMSADHDTTEEVLSENDYIKKRRRSTTKVYKRDKNKDLSVGYDQNKIVVESTINTVDIDKQSQGNDNDNVICTPYQDDSEFKDCEKKNIHDRKQNLNTAANESYLDEKECILNVDNNKLEQEKLVISNIKDKSDNISDDKEYSRDIGKTQDAESPGGTSSGHSTYTVEGEAAPNKIAKDKTYPIENEKKDTNIQVQNEKNHLGVKSPMNGLSAKQRRRLQPIDTSTPNRRKTYNVEGSAEAASTSPDNTDNEISSLTDLPTEDKSPRDYISPGEEKVTSSFSDSYAATTTDYGSLSLGEVPIPGAKKLSDTRMRNNTTEPITVSPTSYKMEEALNAISEELTRCRQLLAGQLPSQVIPGLLSDYGADRY